LGRMLDEKQHMQIIIEDFKAIKDLAVTILERLSSPSGE